MKQIKLIAMLMMSAMANAQDAQVSMELAAVVEWRIEGDSATLSCAAPTAMTTESGTSLFPPGIWKMAAPEWARFESSEAIEESRKRREPK